MVFGGRGLLLFRPFKSLETLCEARLECVLGEIGIGVCGRRRESWMAVGKAGEESLS